MVNAAVTDAREAERTLAIGYAAVAARPALLALLALDARLGGIVASTSEPLIGQMRLTWWREALVRLDAAPAPAEPVLAALAMDVVPAGVTGATLAAIIDGWETLFGEAIDEAALAAFGHERGGRLFAAMAVVLGGDPATVERAGSGWALADLAGRLSAPVPAARARDMAATCLAGVGSPRWPHALRPIGALALLARADLDGISPGSPRRVARLGWHRLTGR